MNKTMALLLLSLVLTGCVFGPGYQTRGYADRGRSDRGTGDRGWGERGNGEFHDGRDQRNERAR